MPTGVAEARFVVNASPTGPSHDDNPLTTEAPMTRHASKPAPEPAPDPRAGRR